MNLHKTFDATFRLTALLIGSETATGWIEHMADVMGFSRDGKRVRLRIPQLGLAWFDLADGMGECGGEWWSICPQALESARRAALRQRKMSCQ